MTDFLFLFRGGGLGPNPSPEDMQRSLQKWGGWIQGLAQAGKFKAGEPLERGGKVVAGARKLVTDGPFVESKEVVGGYLIVTAASLDEATTMSAGCPVLDEGGSVEIRQIHPMQM
jgi:hypothetical protein